METGRVSFGPSESAPPGLPLTMPLLQPEALESIEFFVPGQPTPKGRARSRIVNTRDGRQFVNHYTPKETESYENRIAALAHQAMNGAPPWVGPVRLEMHIRLLVPASWSGKKRRACYAHLMVPGKKPDSANVLKSIEDGMNAIVYADDALIVDHVISKRYGETPGVLVRVVKLAMASA